MFNYSPAVEKRCAMDANAAGKSVNGNTQHVRTDRSHGDAVPGGRGEAASSLMVHPCDGSDHSQGMTKVRVARCCLFLPSHDVKN